MTFCHGPINKVRKEGHQQTGKGNLDRLFRFAMTSKRIDLQGETMKVAFKSLIAAAAFITAGAASAATVTVTLGNTVYKGHTVSGSEVLTFGADANSWLDVLKASVTANGASTVVTTKDSDGYYGSVAMSAPLASLNVDGVTDDLQSAAGTGGITVTAPVLRAISSGGTVTITDLNVDLNTKTVYATVIGANGVGTAVNVAMWTLDTVLGPTNIALPSNGSGQFNLTVQGMHLTANGNTLVTSALGLGSLGKAATAAISDFGSIAMSITSTAVPPQAACSVSFKTTSLNTSTPLFNTEVTVANNSSNAATGWAVNWTYGKPTLLVNVKNAKLSNKSLKSYTAQAVATNATVAAGGSTSFSFRGYAGGTIPAVSDLSATLGGQACAVSGQ